MLSPIEYALLRVFLRVAIFFTEYGLAIARSTGRDPADRAALSQDLASLRRSLTLAEINNA